MQLKKPSHKETDMLDTETIEIVKSTAPILADMGPQLTAHFYDRMFEHNPELKDIFNMSNQRNGRQREALFQAICAYATHIDNLSALTGAVERIAQKHSVFQLREEHYQIVGTHLLATIDELLSPGEAVLGAWGKAYGVLAEIFLQREHQIIEDNGQKEGGWSGLRDFVLIEKTPESAIITSFVFAPVDGGKVVAYKPGQYIGIYVRSEQFEEQEIRQYSLSSAVQADRYRISVKREAKGKVSSFLHDHLQEGDTVQLVPPAGDFFLDITPDTPVALISGGVGLTPMLSMLESLTNHQADVIWAHATEHGKWHAFKDHTQQLATQHKHISQHIWYNNPSPEDTQGQDFDFTGFMQLEPLAPALQQPNTQAYFCGPIGFMQHVAKQLLALGLSQEQCHYECFGPHQIL
jgi:nitric oxide dioxygenase